MSLGNPTSIIIVALIGLAAILFLIASFTGGGKWKKLYHEESEDRARYANDAESDLRETRLRIGELERENAALQGRLTEADKEMAALRAASVAPAAVAPAIVSELPPAPPPAPVVEEAHFEPVAEEPLVLTSAPEPEAVVHTAPEPAPAKTWFGASRDDLSRMRGIDDVMKTRLFGLGITSYDDIVHLSAEDEMALEQRLGVPVGLIGRDQWRDQAALLRAGNDAEFNERFGNVNA